MKPQTLEEKLLWYSIIGGYGIALLGIQEFWIPLVTWFLALRLFWKLWNQTEETPEDQRIRVPLMVWIWMAAVLMIEVAIVMSHLDWNFGPERILSSTVFWFRSWALLALLPLLGCLSIRPELLYRATSIFCIQNLVLSLLCYLLYFAGRQGFGFTALPGYFLGKTGWRVELFMIDWTQNAQLRLLLFAKYANALGLIACVYFFLCARDSNKWMRFLGMTGAALMVYGSVSRLTMVALVVVPILTWCLTNLINPLFYWLGAIGSFVGGILATSIIAFKENFWEEHFERARAGSKITRDKVVSMSLQQAESAPIWGHGITDPQGPIYTDLIPLGTHHQWVGLFYLYGIVGVVSFAIPFTLSLIDLLLKAQKSKVAATGLSVYLVLWMASFGGEIQGLGPWIYPALIITGMGFRQPLPFFSETSEVPIAHS